MIKVGDRIILKCKQYTYSTTQDGWTGVLRTTLDGSPHQLLNIEWDQAPKTYLPVYRENVFPLINEIKTESYISYEHKNKLKRKSV